MCSLYENICSLTQGSSKTEIEWEIEYFFTFGELQNSGIFVADLCSGRHFQTM